MSGTKKRNPDKWNGGKKERHIFLSMVTATREGKHSRGKHVAFHSGSRTGVKQVPQDKSIRTEVIKSMLNRDWEFTIYTLT